MAIHNKYLSLTLITRNRKMFGAEITSGWDYDILPGADPGFQVRGGGAHFKKLRRAEGGAKIFGVFRVKNHHFTQKKSSFPILGRSAPCSPSPPRIRPWFRSCGLQNHPPTPSIRPSMKNLKSIVDNYNVFQVHYIV